jgi:hypothetical protein
MPLRKKKKTEQMVLKNFVITRTKKGDVVIQTKSFDWKMELGFSSSFGQQLDYMLKNNSKSEVEELITELYYTSTSMLTDMELAKIIRDYFEAKIKAHLKEVSEESEEKDLKIVKEITDDRKKTT